MSSAIFRPRGRLRPRRSQVRSNEEHVENKPKTYVPYALLASLAALIALLPFLGLLSVPHLPSTIAGVVPATLSAEGFSCKPAAELASDFRGFAFDTNSTINSFSIDRNTKVVTVDVNGPDGSGGIFCITIPKSFIPTSELRSTIDNIPANSSIQELSNVNVVSLQYHHSDHVLRISGVSFLGSELNTATNTATNNTN